ncbi:unnamed protein product, partial [Urochloa humidicola]
GEPFLLARRSGSGDAASWPTSSSRRRRLISRSRGRLPGSRSGGPLLPVRELPRQHDNTPQSLLHLDIELRRRRIDLRRRPLGRPPARAAAPDPAPPPHIRFCLAASTLEEGGAAAVHPAALLPSRRALLL